MADFVKNEAEESEDEIINRKRKRDLDDDEDDEEKLREEMKDLINDDDEEEENDKEDSDEEIVRKRKKHHEDYDALEDEDYDLIEENLGVKVQRKKKFKRVRCIMDEESDNEEAEESGQVDDCEAIANELFEGDDMEGDDDASPLAADDTHIGDLEESEGESEDENDFIVDDDGQPISKAKKKRHIKYANAALQEVHEFLGYDFDYADFAQEDEYDEKFVLLYEEEDEEEGVERPRQKKSLKRDVKQNLLNTMHSQAHRLKRIVRQSVSSECAGTSKPDEPKRRKTEFPKWYINYAKRMEISERRKQQRHNEKMKYSQELLELKKQELAAKQELIHLRSKKD